MCGTSPLPGRRRSWCSDACVDLWNIAAAGQAAYAHLVQIHGQICWGCGEREQDGTRWTSTGEQPCRVPIVLEVEHVRPLWSLTDLERTQLRWWLPYNLQLLCPPCHKAKSAREAAERAAAKRAAAEAQCRLLPIETGRPNVVPLRPA